MVRDISKFISLLIGIRSYLLSKRRHLLVFLEGLSDPFVVMKLNEQTFQTKKQEKTLNPKWNLDYVL